MSWPSPFPPGLEPVDDVRPAAWVERALKDWPGGGKFLVRHLIPPDFEAYARVLHRPHRPTDRHVSTGTWRERAAELARPLGPKTSWRRDLEVTMPTDEHEIDWMPNDGSLSEPEVAILAPLLSEHTSTPDGCWFALWAGFGFLRPGSSFLLVGGSPRRRWATHRTRFRERIAIRRARRAAARRATFDLLGESGRSYLLLRGSVGDARRFRFGGPWFQSPTLWWPEDRSWFVHTEIDAMSTYLGGSRALIDRLVGGQILESFEVQEDSLAAM